MNFKRFHESKNLFDKYAEYTVGQTAYQYTISGLTPNQKYTCSTNFVAETGKEAAIYFNGGSTVTNGVDYRTPKTFTCGSSGTMSVYVRFQSTSQSNPAIYDDLMNGTIWIMVNEGSTALPYESYSSEVWHDIPYYKHSTATDTLSLPATLYPNDTSITVGVKGQSSQNGTPSPSLPVDVNGVGDIINLFDKNATDTDNGYVDACYLREDGSENLQQAYFISEYIGVEETATYTLLYGTTAGNVGLCYYDSNKEYISGTRYGSRLPFTFTTPVNAKYIRFSAIRYSNIKDIITLNRGSESLPYIAYGQYGIPISSGSTTTLVPLGDMQTTRQIKKLVLTGEENWEQQSGQTADYFRISNIPALPSKVFCTHFLSPDENINYASTVTGIKMQQSSSYGVILACRPGNVSTLEGFTDYLATQYANGTPVTVWYVLATPEITIINEPLMKIGDYADEVTGISIPVTAGANTLSVGTTLQPSEVTATYHGWHPVSAVHERDNGAWT